MCGPGHPVTGIEWVKQAIVMDSLDVAHLWIVGDDREHRPVGVSQGKRVFCYHINVSDVNLMQATKERKRVKSEGV